jgi:hypothetical protein
MKELINIQEALKAPKNQYSTFGKYHYRSCEDILEALKPLLKEQGATLVISDEIKQVGEFTFVEATAMLKNEKGNEAIVQAQAGIQQKKGFDLAQSFGSASSYARKYALNGLFLIDDTKDADHDSNKKPILTAAIAKSESKKGTEIEVLKEKYVFTLEQESKYLELLNK